jgi:hypothetical protein
VSECHQSLQATLTPLGEKLMSEKYSHKETKTLGVGIAIGIAIMTPFGIILSITTGNIAFIGLGLPLGIAIGTAISVTLNEGRKV